MMSSVPVVDLRDFFNSSTRDEFVKQIGAAFKQFGFIRVSGHQLDEEMVRSSYEAVSSFFALSPEQKRQYVIKGGAGQRGYTPFRSENAKDNPFPDLKEFWHVGRELPPEHPLYSSYMPNIWPSEIDGFRQVLLRLYHDLEQCSNVLLRALALFLEQPEDAFTNLTDNGNTILRALYYPALTSSQVHSGSIRAAAHEDINFITLLITSTSSGLQILSDGKWLDVNAQPGEIIADSGDMLSRVTNGFIPATTHRVVNPDNAQQARYSMPFFVHPRPNAILRVLDNCRGENFPQPPGDISGIEFLEERLREIGLMKV